MYLYWQGKHERVTSLAITMAGHGVHIESNSQEFSIQLIGI